jgi:hypothetical protein
MPQGFYRMEKYDSRISEASELFRPCAGVWEVEKVFCVPRAGMVSEEGAAESPIIGKRLTISEDFQVNFDNMDFHFQGITTDYLSSEMERDFNLYGIDAARFGRSVTFADFTNQTMYFGLVLKEDGGLVLFVREDYGTDGFYLLKRV